VLTLGRSHKDRITWARMTQLADDWLPKPIILHPWPSDRFAVTHPRWEPYAGKPHVRFCAGGVRRARSRRRCRCSGFLAAHRSLLQCTLHFRGGSICPYCRRPMEAAPSAQTDRVGTWVISGLTGIVLPRCALAPVRRPCAPRLFYDDLIRLRESRPAAENYGPGLATSTALDGARCG
jgi:hypothetical protein